MNISTSAAAAAATSWQIVSNISSFVETSNQILWLDIQSGAAIMPSNIVELSNFSIDELN